MSKDTLRKWMTEEEGLWVPHARRRDRVIHLATGTAINGRLLALTAVSIAGTTVTAAAE